MSQDSLIDDQENIQKDVLQSSSTITIETRTNNTMKSSTNGNRSINLDEHIKSVKQKKEEADILRLRRLQEQLNKKEQKWQQQQIERVKNWLKLRNRDSEHRTQVEERRKKRDEDLKSKFDELLRREKEREQRTPSQLSSNSRGNVSHKPESVMSLSTDVISSRRAISASSRIRSTKQDMTNRQGSNDSPISTTSQENADNAATVISSHQQNSNTEHRYSNRLYQSHDVTMTNENSSLSDAPCSTEQSRSRAVPTSYSYWLNTGDNNNSINASFMRLTYAATCRLRTSRSVERCPRACRARDELPNAPTPVNNETPRRVQSINRQQLNETIERLSKPKHTSMSQSIHINSTTSSVSNGIPSSHSSHQLRIPNLSASVYNNITSTSASSNNRRHVQSRPVTASPNSAVLNNSQTSSNEDSNNSSNRQSSSHRSNAHPRLPIPPSSKPPISSFSSRSKTPVPRSQMSPSHSSSSISTSVTTNKQNIRRIPGQSPSKRRPKSEVSSSTSVLSPPLPPTSSPSPSPSDIVETLDNGSNVEDNEKQNLSLNETTHVEQIPNETQSFVPSVEPINIDQITEIINSSAVPVAKREQQNVDEQEYQRKLSQKIREAQQRIELERQREEERKRQLEQEEYEHEQEQIRLAEEQRRLEQERLQRAIEERERENELKRQEEQRLQQQREELEKKQVEETERVNRERQERIKKEEEERNERKKRLDLIMRRTRQVSPSVKPENNSTTDTNETDNHDPKLSPISHSNSDSRFPTSLSTDNIVNTSDSSTPETPKFKSSLIQNLLNKARNSRSTDNLIQNSMTSSQIMTESMLDDEAGTIPRNDLSDDDNIQDININNTTNGHIDLSLSSSTNLNSYHDHSVETDTPIQ